MLSERDHEEEGIVMTTTRLQRVYTHRSTDNSRFLLLEVIVVLGSTIRNYMMRIKRFRKKVKC